MYTIKYRPHSYHGSLVVISKRPWHVYTPHCEYMSAYKTKEAAEKALKKLNKEI